MSITQQLVELIRTNTDYTQARPHYVSIYKKEQCYGGPQEGGWWHTVYTLEGSVSFASEHLANEYVQHATQLAQELKHQADKSFQDDFVANHRDDVDYEDDFCTGETCGSEDYLVIVEVAQGSLDNRNQPIPHWE